MAAKGIPKVVLWPLYTEFLKIHDAKSQTLTQCFVEQVQHRILRAPAALAAQNEAPPPMDDLDHSDAEERSLAKEMHNFRSAVVRTRQAYT